MIQRHPNAAPAKKRVGFFDREVGQCLVTTNIEGAHGDWAGGKHLQLLAVNLLLFALTREAVAHHEGHFGTVQTHAFGSAFETSQGIGQQPGVYPQWNTVAVECFGWFIPQHFKIGLQGAFFVVDFLIVLTQLGAGTGNQHTAVTINDDFTAIELVVRQVDHTHDGRNAHRPSQNGHVGVGRAFDRNQTAQLAGRDFSQHARRQFLTDQNTVLDHFNIVELIACFALQVRQNACAQIRDVGSAFAQVGIFHLLEVTNVLHDHLTQRALRPLTFLNAITDFHPQGIVVQHVEINVEQRHLFRA